MHRLVSRAEHHITLFREMGIADTVRAVRKWSDPLQHHIQGPTGHFTKGADRNIEEP